MLKEQHKTKQNNSCDWNSPNHDDMLTLSVFSLDQHGTMESNRFHMALYLVPHSLQFTGFWAFIFFTLTYYSLPFKTFYFLDRTERLWNECWIKWNFSDLAFKWLWLMPIYSLLVLAHPMNRPRQAISLGDLLCRPPKWSTVTLLRLLHYLLGEWIWTSKV